MINNILRMISAQIQSGVSPNAILSRMAQQDKRVEQVMQITKGKSNAEMRQYAENLAKERGIDFDTFVRSLGITIPSDR